MAALLVKMRASKVLDIEFKVKKRAKKNSVLYKNQKTAKTIRKFLVVNFREWFLLKKDMSSSMVRTNIAVLDQLTKSLNSSIVFSSVKFISQMMVIRSLISIVESILSCVLQNQAKFMHVVNNFTHRWKQKYLKRIQKMHLKLKCQKATSQFSAGQMTRVTPFKSMLWRQTVQ